MTDNALRQRPMPGLGARFKVKPKRSKWGTVAPRDVQETMAGGLYTPEIRRGFARLAPAFEHFGISVICKGKRNPVWTLKADGKVIRVTADGTVEIVK